MLETAKFKQAGPAVTTGRFNPDLFERGMWHLCGSGDEPVHTTHWAGRRGFVEPHTYRYRPTTADAGHACARAGRFEPGDSLALLNVVRRGTKGLPTAADILAVRGHAIRLLFGPSWSADMASDESPTVPIDFPNFMQRMFRAGAEPIIFVDPIGGAYWALWPLDRPDYLSGNESRRTAYRAQAGRLAAAVGSVASEEPLTVALPMPGVTDFCIGYPNIFREASVASLSISEMTGGEMPKYGLRFEDLDEMIARIEATPAIDLSAKGNA